jgi:hypothetical protein
VPTGRNAGEGLCDGDCVEWAQGEEMRRKEWQVWPYGRRRVCITTDYDMSADMEGVKKGSGGSLSSPVTRCASVR